MLGKPTGSRGLGEAGPSVVENPGIGGWRDGAGIVFQCYLWNISFYSFICCFVRYILSFGVSMGMSPKLHVSKGVSEKVTLKTEFKLEKCVDGKPIFSKPGVLTFKTNCWPSYIRTPNRF